MEPVSRPEDLIGLPIPDLVLADTEDRPFPVRQFVGRSPLVLFFIVKSGTPG